MGESEFSPGPEDSKTPEIQTFWKGSGETFYFFSFALNMKTDPTPSPLHKWVVVGGWGVFSCYLPLPAGPGCEIFDPQHAGYGSAGEQPERPLL